MKALYQSALALTVIAVIALGLGSGCTAELATSEDLQAPEPDGSPLPLAQYAYGPQLLSALDARREALVDTDPALADAYFSEPLTDIETTADNGMRQLWAGGVGRGAIYAHPRRTHGEAHLVYGEIFTLWQQSGAESLIGYPLEEERDAGWGCDSNGALREQAFTAGIEAPGYHRVLCWAPGRIWIFEWVDEGAELQRLPPAHRGS